MCSIQSVNVEPAEGKTNVFATLFLFLFLLLLLACCPLVTSQAIQKKHLWIVVDRASSSDNLQSHIFRNFISGVQISSQPNRGIPAMSELVDDAVPVRVVVVVVTDDIAEVDQVVAAELVIVYFLHVKGRAFESKAVVLPLKYMVVVAALRAIKVRLVGFDTLKGCIDLRARLDRGGSMEWRNYAITPCYVDVWYGGTVGVCVS